MNIDTKRSSFNSRRKKFNALEWIIGQEGRNLKFRREALLNYAMNRWGLNKTNSVGPTSKLIRECSPNSYEEWERFYFENAQQLKRNGVRITREYLQDLGRKLYIKLSEIVHSELNSIQEEECIDYVMNLVLNRTFEGYQTEIRAVYQQLQHHLDHEIKPAYDRWDRTYNVDFYISIGNRYIGIQIKPLSAEMFPNRHQMESIHERTHRRFTEEFGGRVFFVYSIAEGRSKVIANPEVIEEIRQEISRLSS